MKPSSVWFRGLLLIAVFAAVASACQVGAASTTVRTSRTEKSAAHKAGGVSSHLTLSSRRLVSGAAEPGTLVIVNHTGRPIRWNCPYLEVQLTNAQWPFQIHPTPCNPRPKTLRVGTTRLPVTLRARQTVCQGSCKLLPPGTYHTHVFATTDVVHAPAVTVHVIAESKPA